MLFGASEGSRAGCVCVCKCGVFAVSYVNGTFDRWFAYPSHMTTERGSGAGELIWSAVVVAEKGLAEEA